MNNDIDYEFDEEKIDKAVNKISLPGNEFLTRFYLEKFFADAQYPENPDIARDLKMLSVINNLTPNEVMKKMWYL